MFSLFSLNEDSKWKSMACFDESPNEDRLSSTAAKRILLKPFCVKWSPLEFTLWFLKGNRHWFDKAFVKSESELVKGHFMNVFMELLDWSSPLLLKTVFWQHLCIR
jgi:hypothetical protein